MKRNAGERPQSRTSPRAVSRETLPRLTPDEFARLIGVSRETLGRLKAHADLLKRWQNRVNLVGAASLGDVWRRHFLDSAQIFPLLPPGALTLLDVGSGAGFPGLVLAILGVPEVHLIEADRKKCAFLREAARLAGARVHIHAARVEDLSPWLVDVITGRAVAPLERLLDLVSAFLSPTTCCIFSKGASVDAELAEARLRWRMDAKQFPSLSAPSGRILKLERIMRHEQR